MNSLDILYEDNHLLVVNKPAGLATMGAASGNTLHGLAADYLKRKFNKPGKAFVGIVSRLDTITSGVLVLARTSKAASRLSAQFADHHRGAGKIYLAAVAPRIADKSGCWSDWLAKDERAHRMRVVSATAPQAKRAKLKYARIGDQNDYSLMAVGLETGRKHQVRVQFADHGHPVIGDRKYGSQRPFAGGVALHSWRLQIVHPTRRETMTFSAPPPSSWRQLPQLPRDWERIWSQADTALQALLSNTDQ